MRLMSKYLLVKLQKDGVNLRDLVEEINHYKSNILLPKIIQKHTNYEYKLILKNLNSLSLNCALTFKEAVELSSEITNSSAIEVFLNHGGKINCTFENLFDAAKSINSAILRSPRILEEDLYVINKYKNCKKIDDLMELTDYLKLSGVHKEEIFNSFSKLPPQKTSKYMRAVIQWFIGFKSVKSRRKDAISLPKADIESIYKIFLGEKRKPAIAAHYYTPYKSPNPLKTAGNGKIDLAELEFLHPRLYSYEVSKLLNVHFKWIVIDESSETGISDGISNNILEQNEDIISNYLKLTGADNFIEFRSMKKDIIDLLESKFEDIYLEKIPLTRVIDEQTFNLAIFASHSHLYSKGFNKDDIESVIKATLTRNKEDLTEHIWGYAYGLSQRLLTLKSIKESIKSEIRFNNKKLPQIYSDLLIKATVIRDPRRLSILSKSDIEDKSRLPNYGIPLYNRGIYLGVVNFCEAVKNIDKFLAYNIGNQIIAFEYSA